MKALSRAVDRYWYLEIKFPKKRGPKRNEARSTELQ